MPEPAARAWLCDLPNSELHFLDVGHWLLETNFNEAAPLVRNFLVQVHGT